jgi:hypothetical protein
MYQKIIPFILAAFLVIGSTAPVFSDVKDLQGKNVCAAGTMQENINGLVTEGYEVAKVTLIQDPKVIGPFLDGELQTGSLSEDSLPIDAIYILELLIPASLVILAISYKDCYKGHKMYNSSPFIEA